MRIFISEKLSEHKYKTPEGYLICTDAILARTGKQEYKRGEVFGIECKDAESLINIDRTEKEVFSDAALASFENKPITVEHPDEDVNIDNYKDYAVGFVRDVRRGEYDGQPVMIGNLVITDARTIEEIENGEHTDLSCGYDCDILDEENPQQRNIRGNHVALCQQGRAGIARIVDSAKDSYYTSAQKENKEFVENAVKEMSRYINNWSFMSAQEKRNVGCSLSELKARVKELQSVKDSIKDFKKVRYGKPASYSKKYYVVGSEEEGDIHDNLKTLSEAKSKLRELRRFDKEEGLDATYYINECYETDNEVYHNEIMHDSVNDTPADIEDIDTSNYVVGNNGVWFAKPKSQRDMFDIAYASNDKGKTWHTCNKEKKSASSTRGSQTQAGKIFFRTSSSFPGPRTSIGRNVLTWCSNNNEHHLPYGYEIDHVDGNYLNDRLSNLEKVTHSENIKRRNAMMNKDSINDDGLKVYQVRGGYAIVPLRYWKNYKQGSFVERVESSLDSARYTRWSLERCDGIDYIIIDCTQSGKFKIVDSINDKLVDLNSQQLREIENTITSLGFKISKKGKTIFGNQHYQVISTQGGYSTKAHLEEYVRKLDTLDDLIEKHYHAPMTYNVALQNDGYISAGIDISEAYIKDSCQNLTKITKIMSIMKKL